MAVRTISKAALVAVGLVGGCGDEPLAPVFDDGALETAAVSTTRPVTSLADGATVGSSTFRRTRHGVTMTMVTTGIPAGHTVTVWFVVPGAGSARAAGNVIGGSGRARFGGHLSADGVLADPMRDEVHLVVRSHGPRIPGRVDEQIMTPGGGCTSELPAGQMPTAPGECATVQLSVHD